MKLYLERYSSGAEDTLGKLYINGTLQCLTLEDQDRKVKVKGDTRIPAGTYEIVLRKEGTHHLQYASGKYGEEIKKMHAGMLHLINVPNFKYILIHIGNEDEDTEGCLLVGSQIGASKTKNKNKRALIGSKLAYIKIYPQIAQALLKGEKVTIEIVNKG